MQARKHTNRILSVVCHFSLLCANTSFKGSPMPPAVCGGEGNRLRLKQEAMHRARAVMTGSPLDTDALSGRSSVFLRRNWTSLSLNKEF